MLESWFLPLSFGEKHATMKNWPSSSCKMSALVTYRYFHCDVLFLKLVLSVLDDILMKSQYQLTLCLSPVSSL